MSESIKLTGLWIKESRNGEKFMQGSLGGALIFVNKNGFKKEAKDPDFYISLVKREPRERQGDSNKGDDFFDKEKANIPDPKEEDFNDIPF